jgi:hypothetical protein
MYVLYKVSVVMFWSSRTVWASIPDCFDIYTWTKREFDIFLSKQLLNFHLFYWALPMIQEPWSVCPHSSLRVSEEEETPYPTISGVTEEVETPYPTISGVTSVKISAPSASLSVDVSVLSPGILSAMGVFHIL